MQACRRALRERECGAFKEATMGLIFSGADTAADLPTTNDREVSDSLWLKGRCAGHKVHIVRHDLKSSPISNSYSNYLTSSYGH